MKNRYQHLITFYINIEFYSSGWSIDYSFTRDQQTQNIELKPPI